MSADLYIHVMKGITEKDIADFQSNVFGSKYFNLSDRDDRDFSELYSTIGHTPREWIGEVSWLKAGLFEDYERYIPATVEKIDDVIGEDLPILDNELKKKILDAFDEENETQYNLASKETVKKFLEDNMGEHLFTISW